MELELEPLAAPGKGTFNPPPGGQLPQLIAKEVFQGIGRPVIMGLRVPVSSLRDYRQLKNSVHYKETESPGLNCRSNF